MKRYTGSRFGNIEVKVTSDTGGYLLLPHDSQALHNHSTDGFNWGYGGSGPAQLALAILLDLLGPAIAQEYHQRFKWDCVSMMLDQWEITEEEIKAWLAHAVAADGKSARAVFARLRSKP